MFYIIVLCSTLSNEGIQEFCLIRLKEQAGAFQMFWITSLKSNHTAHVLKFWALHQKHLSETKLSTPYYSVSNSSQLYFNLCCPYLAFHPGNLKDLLSFLGRPQKNGIMLLDPTCCLFSATGFQRTHHLNKILLRCYGQNPSAQLPPTRMYPNLFQNAFSQQSTLYF